MKIILSTLALLLQIVEATQPSKEENKTSEQSQTLKFDMTRLAQFTSELNEMSLIFIPEEEVCNYVTWDSPVSSSPNENPSTEIENKKPQTEIENKNPLTEIENKCPICFYPFIELNNKAKNDLVMILHKEITVPHSFCNECICQWLEKNQTCPSCRLDIKEGHKMIVEIANIRLKERIVKLNTIANNKIPDSMISQIENSNMNNVPKIECLNYISDLIFSEKAKNSNISNALRNIGRLILKSTELNDEGTRRIFRPYFFYKPELLYNDGILDVNEVAQCWGSVLRLKNCLKIQNFWNKKISEPQVASKIEKFNISCRFIGDEGVKIMVKGLENLHNLIELDISNNAIRKEGIQEFSKALKELSKLKKLDISHNEIGEKEAIEILKIIENLNCLEKLEIAGNNIGKEGGVIALSEALEKLNNLRELNISHNRIGNEGVVTLLKKLTNLKVLNISHNDIGDEGVIEILKVIENLNYFEKLDISGNYIGNNAIKMIEEIKERKPDLKIKFWQSTSYLNGVQNRLTPF